MKDEGNCEKLKRILKELPVGIGIFDENREPLFVNEEMRKIIDFLNNTDLFLKGDRLFEELYLPLLDRITGFSSYSTSHGWFVISKDITRKKMETEEDKKILELIDHLFSMVRHEIGNPINTIKFSLSVLKEDIDNFPKEKVLAYIERLMEEIEQLERILDVMKRFSSYGYVSLKKVELREFLKRFIRAEKEEIVSKNIKLETQLPTKDIYVKADPTALRQVLKNIINNSIEALEEKEDNRKIEISIKETEDTVVVQIKDNGFGIPPHIMKKVFFPFFSTKSKGSGMGLTISQGLITAMGGKISLKSFQEGTQADVILRKWK